MYIIGAYLFANLNGTAMVALLLQHNDGITARIRGILDHIEIGN